ncbi:MAG: sigma-70 family RNA polymerase sigma factor [Candidatus Margulisbacteria bacterium]|nr:sigma-70 family RNA polymerase sigma factor [Candidatus Margulisiibacteriota bacterium]
MKTTVKERVILMSAKQGSVKDKEILLTDNLGLIYTFVRRYDPAMFHDIFQEACIGLLTAADKYEFDRGTKFSTYASFWINQAVQRSYQQLKRNMRIPSTTLECIHKIKKVITKYMTEKHRVPTSDEISEMTGIHNDKVEYYQQIEKDVVSLDDMYTDGEDCMLDYIEDRTALTYQDDLENEGFEDTIGQALSVLSEKERMIIELHYGFYDRQEQSLAEIGRTLNVSRERVRQLKDRALEKMKKSEAGKKLKNYL